MTTYKLTIERSSHPANWPVIVHVVSKGMDLTFGAKTLKAALREAMEGIKEMESAP